MYKKIKAKILLNRADRLYRKGLKRKQELLKELENLETQLIKILVIKHRIKRSLRTNG